MEKIRINGGRPLKGTIEISGMKNAALPILIGSILTEEKCEIENLPDIDDVRITLSILRSMGAVIEENRDENTVSIDTANIVCGSAPSELVSQMRASYYIAGAELGRFGRTSVGCPGGCDLGERPIDQHIKAFEAIGAIVDSSNGLIEGEAPDGIHNTEFCFDINTVGGTINLMLAAVKAPGLTVIENAAREPHIVDLANFLNTCGAHISGAGTDTIKIKGVDKLYGCTYAIIPDMIEAGTFMVAAAATKGDLVIDNVIPKHLESITQKLRAIGVDVIENDESVEVKYRDGLKSISLRALPYPGFPTDMQPQMCTLMCLADKGLSIITDGVYNNRFKYVNQLKKMGADIHINERSAIVSGHGKLNGSNVKAVDLRAGAAMIIAGLAAEGTTDIEDIHHIERGYTDIVGKLRGVGADIRKIEE